jgi:hypothetical protein
LSIRVDDHTGQCIELFNNMTYQGKLKASPTNSDPVWDDFTRSDPIFRQKNLAGQRRVCGTVAEQAPNSTSFVNFGQIEIALSLVQALEQLTTAQG